MDFEAMQLGTSHVRDRDSPDACSGEENAHANP